MWYNPHMPRMLRRKILVSIPTEQYAERLKLEGVLKYAHEKSGERWDIVLDVGHWQCSELGGIIAYVTSSAHRRQMLAAKVPTVLIEDRQEPKSFSHRPDVATILCDHAAEGQTAALYFLDRHYRNFAFVGTATDWSRRRGEGFARALAKRGFACRTVTADSLRGLPKPCAVFAAHDILARRVLAAAERFGIAVPDELAVLGVDNDEVMCTTSAPALSSIPTFDRSLGYAAGRALNELLCNRSHGRIIRTRHAKVVTRASTQKDAIDDPFVARTLDWIRSHLAENLSAESLAQRIGYSKHALQMRVERALGTTLGAVVRHIRLDTAESLLAETDMPVSEIAERCGYSSTSHLAMHVREAHGITPLAYRRRFP